jgi:homoserine trans-succinylase
LISDEDIVRKLLLKVVDASNKEQFCEFLTDMAKTMKEVRRKYFGTSIILVKGAEKSTIKWVDFHYWCKLSPI